MALSQENSAPYAPKSVLLGLLEKNRTTGLPNPIDKSALSRLGVSDSLLDRTMRALIVLDIVDEDGTHSEMLNALRIAPEAEYPQRMAEWLNSVYADIIQYVDPSSGNEVAVRDAFRVYKPVSQQDRMVNLFAGLYAAAGIWPEDVKRKPSTSRTANSKQPSPKTPPPSKKRQRPTPSDSASSPSTISEKALEYRLVDLMGEAVGDQEVMQAIIKVITYLKTKDAPSSAPKALEDHTEG